MKYEVSKHRIKASIPWSQTCFGCNQEATTGIGMRAFITEDGYVVGLCRTNASHEGYPGVIHGGIVSTYLDEVLWHATRVAQPDLLAMTAEMTVCYKRPVPSDTQVRIVGEPAIIDGRHIFVNGYVLLPDDEIAATACIHYIAVKQDNRLHKDEPARVMIEHAAPEELLWF